MNIKTIQDNLDATIRKECETDWAKAKEEAQRILNPFIRPLAESRESRDKVAEICSTLFTPDWYGIHPNDNIPVPEEYVKKMQAEASEAFVERVKHLAEELKDIQQYAEEE